MSAILKRELRAYFVSPLGYIFIGAIYLLTGFYFYTSNVYLNSTNTTTLFSNLFSVVLFLVPILTMRLLSEERRSKTEQTLLTSPVSRFSIVFAKYLAALSVYVAAISATLVMAVIIEIYSVAEWPVVFGNFIGLLLLGAALIAICLFVSALTESQVIAAVGGFAISMFLILVDALYYVVSNRALRMFFSYFSFNDRYKGFTIGLLDLSNVCFFLSIAALFVCLTTVVLERRRWN